MRRRIDLTECEKKNFFKITKGKYADEVAKNRSSNELNICRTQVSKYA